jgi:hypothetical protein
MFKRVNAYLSLQSLAVCARAHLPAVFVMIKFSCPHCVYNKLPQPCLKCTGIMKKKTELAKSAF